VTQDPGSSSPMSDRMQSLLSRAVEDQLSEQRQVASILAEVRGQLARLDEQLGALRSSDGGGTEHLQDALTGVGTDLREAVRILAERIDGVARLVQQRGHDLAEIRASIDELRESVDTHVTAIGGISGGLAALPAFGERIDALQEGLGGLRDRLGGLEELVAGVTALQQRADATDTGLRELRHAFTGVAARIAELPPRADIEVLLARPAEAIDGVAARLGRLESVVPSLLERLDSIEQQGAEHGRRFADVAEGLQATTGGAAAGADRSAFEELADTVTDLRDELRARLSELAAGREQSDVADRLSARLDELHGRLAGTEELHERVAGLADATAAAARADDVADAVQRAVADSERRITAHVDEAVLALAEAMLRRRSGRSARTAYAGDEPAAEAVAEAVEPEAVVDDALDEDDVLDEAADDEDAQDEAAGDEAADEAADDEPDEAPAEKPVPWQTPLLTGPETQEAPEPPRKRKAWWRPGD
jgi:chromosome segregation ATPase